MEDLFGQLAYQVCAWAPASALEGGMTKMRTKKRSSGFLSPDWLGWGTGNTVGLALVVAAQRQTVVGAKETSAAEQRSSAGMRRDLALVVAFGEVGAFEEASSVVGHLEASSEMGPAPDRERIRLEQALVSSGRRRASGSEEAEAGDQRFGSLAGRCHWQHFFVVSQIG